MGNASTAQKEDRLKEMPASHLFSARNGNCVKIIGSQPFKERGKWRDAIGNKDFVIKFKETTECIVGYMDLTSPNQKAPKIMILSDILEYGFHLAKPTVKVDVSWKKTEGVFMAIPKNPEKEEDDGGGQHNPLLLGAALGENDEEGEEEEEGEDQDGDEEEEEEEGDVLEDILMAEELFEAIDDGGGGGDDDGDGGGDDDNVGGDDGDYGNDDDRGDKFEDDDDGDDDGDDFGDDGDVKEKEEERRESVEDPPLEEFETDEYQNYDDY